MMIMLLEYCELQKGGGLSQQSTCLYLLCKHRGDDEEGVAPEVHGEGQ